MDGYLRRKYPSIIKDIVVSQREDLDLKNHLSGRKRTLLQVGHVHARTGHAQGCVHTVYIQVEGWGLEQVAGARLVLWTVHGPHSPGAGSQNLYIKKT